MKTSDYAKVLTSFSGSDMTCHLVFPKLPNHDAASWATSKPITVGTVTTISYSVFREKRQVRTLGRISAKGITKGSRTVAGTLVFSVINQHFIHDLIKEVPLLKDYGRIKPDELPPFDLVITFANELGQAAKMIIYGVTLIDDAMTLSIEDILTENTLTFYARDIDTMEDLGKDYKNNPYNRAGYEVDNMTPLVKFSIDAILKATDLTNYEALKKQYGL